MVTTISCFTLVKILSKYIHYFHSSHVVLRIFFGVPPRGDIFRMIVAVGNAGGVPGAGVTAGISRLVPWPHSPGAWPLPHRTS